MIQITQSPSTIDIEGSDTRLRNAEGAESDSFCKSLDKAREHDRRESRDMTQTSPDVAALNARELSGQVTLADRAAGEMSESSDAESEGGEESVQDSSQRARTRESAVSTPVERSTQSIDDPHAETHMAKSGVEPTHPGATSSGGETHDHHAVRDGGEKTRLAQTAAVTSTPGMRNAPGGGVSVQAQLPGATNGSTSTKTDVVSSISNMSSFRDAMSRVGAKSGSPQILRAETQVAAQASRIMVQGLRDGKTEVVMRLNPEALGPVKIELSVDEGRVSAKMHAEHDAARELLKAGLDHLRCTLEARGLNVDRLEVVTPAEPGDLNLTSGGFDGADRHGASNGQNPADGNAGGGSGMDDGFATESRMVEPAAESAGMWW